MGKDITLHIEATMPERWASELLGMLNHMEKLGQVGVSRKIVFFSDGDGDFRPKFFFSSESLMPDMSAGIGRINGDVFFGAG